MPAHWQIRASQRAIPQEAIELVLEFGDSVHDHKGAEIIYLSKRARRRIGQEQRDGVPRFDKALDVYLVIANGELRTVGHRYRRLPRP